jgi:RNA polymerase sigma factor (sigma-70 family)
MDERDWLAEQFEEHRTRLRAVAYRMLGSLSEADDAVQEAWIRLSRTDASQVENLGGWLTTVVARVSLNMLRSRKVRREEAMGVRVPEPILDRADAMDPEHEAVLADSVGLALLVVLENLSPPERLAYVLHDRPRPAGQALFYSRMGLVTKPALVNGALGGVSTRDGEPFAVGGYTIRGGKIVEIDILADPERLSALDLTILDD